MLKNIIHDEVETSEVDYEAAERLALTQSYAAMLNELPGDFTNHKLPTGREMEGPPMINLPFGEPRLSLRKYFNNHLPASMFILRKIQ